MRLWSDSSYLHISKFATEKFTITLPISSHTQTQTQTHTHVHIFKTGLINTFKEKRKTIERKVSYEVKILIDKILTSNQQSEI